MLEIETKPDTAAEDAAKLLLNFSGNDYLETDTTLTWLRRENPDARIVTTMLDHFETVVRVIESGKNLTVTDSPTQGVEIMTRQATFRADLHIDGEIVATGHGTETRAKFPGYLEKAESIAIRRMCINAGYSLEMLRQLGFELRLAPDKVKAIPANAQRPAGNYSGGNRSNGNIPANQAPPPPLDKPRPAPPKAVSSTDPPAASAAVNGRVAAMLSGESGPPESEDTPVGCVQAAPIESRRVWRKYIQEVFQQTPEFDAALAILAQAAGASIWRWIIMLSIAHNTKELNAIMKAASANSAGKISGAAWSLATKEKAQSLATAPAPVAS